jgi:hypothetical protein
VTEQDLIQLMLVEVWERSNPTRKKAWDPERGVAMETYVVFHACDRAKKYLRAQGSDKRGVRVTVYSDEHARGSIFNNKFNAFINSNFIKSFNYKFLLNNRSRILKTIRHIVTIA